MIPRSGRSPGEGNGNPLQYSCLEIPRTLLGYSPWGCKESDTTERLHFFFHCSLGLPRWLSGKESACNARDPGSIPGSGRSPGEGNGNPLQYSCLENSMRGGTWWATYSPWGCKESDTTERLHFTSLQPHSYILLIYFYNIKFYV